MSDRVRNNPWLAAAFLTATFAQQICVAQSTQLTPEQQQRVQEAARQEREKTEEARRQQQEQLQAEERATEQTRLDAEIAEAQRNEARAGFQVTGSQVVTDAALNAYQQRDHLQALNVEENVQQIRAAIAKWRVERADAAARGFAPLALEDPFASAGGSSDAPSCLSFDAEWNAIKVTAACGAEVCKGALQAGDVLLTPQGNPLMRWQDVRSFLNQCSVDRGAVVLRPSVNDVVLVP